MKRDLNRVVFYSIQDLSKDRNLQNAEPLIEKFDSKNLYDINDILELYQIKLYFDNELYRSVWNEETKENYLKKVNLFWEVITSFFIKINSDNISDYFKSTDYQYYDSFWTLINQLNIYKNYYISSSNVYEHHKKYSIVCNTKESK